MNRVLVAGGDGFIGRHLVDALARKGAHVIVVDDHSTSRRRDTDAHDVIEVDVANLPLAEIPTVNAVVHLASPAAPHLFSSNRAAVISPNTMGTARLLDLARRDGCRLLYASSS